MISLQNKITMTWFALARITRCCCAVLSSEHPRYEGDVFDPFFFFNYNKNVYSEFDNIVPCLFHICCELRVTLLLRVIIYDLNGDV